MSQAVSPKLLTIQYTLVGAVEDQEAGLCGVRVDEGSFFSRMRYLRKESVGIDCHKQSQASKVVVEWIFLEGVQLL